MHRMVRYGIEEATAFIRHLQRSLVSGMRCRYVGPTRRHRTLPPMVRSCRLVLRNRHRRSDERRRAVSLRPCPDYTCSYLVRYDSATTHRRTTSEQSSLSRLLRRWASGSAARPWLICSPLRRAFDYLTSTGRFTLQAGQLYSSLVFLAESNKTTSVEQCSPSARVEPVFLRQHAVHAAVSTAIDVM